MRKKKINHQEILDKLTVDYDSLKKELEIAKKAWLDNLNGDQRQRAYLYDVYEEKGRELQKLEREIRFHQIMLQEKKYASALYWSDIHAYEIIEEKSDKVILVRRLKATIKPESKKELHDSFVPGDFCGHYDNNLQEWNFEVNESNPIETIRKHKNGLWYGAGNLRFSIESETREYYDYNF